MQPPAGCWAGFPCAAKSPGPWPHPRRGVERPRGYPLAVPDIVLATLNAKWIHAAFGLRCLRANLGELREHSVIRVVIADDQALVRDGFSLILNLEEDIDVVAVAGDGRVAVTLNPARLLISEDDGASWLELAGIGRPGSVAGLPPALLGSGCFSR